MRRGTVTQTDRHIDAVTIILFASATPHAKCNKYRYHSVFNDELTWTTSLRPTASWTDDSAPATTQMNARRSRRLPRGLSGRATTRYRSMAITVLVQTLAVTDVTYDIISYTPSADRRRDGNRSGRPASVAGRGRSTLGDRCVTGRQHKMHSGTSTKRDEHNRLKLARDVFI